MEVLLPTSAPPTARETALCRNCEARLVGPYCAACGQQARESDRLTFHALRHDFAARTLNFDTGLLYTIRLLFTGGPGTVARRYVAGQRRRFTSPVTFLAICCAFYLLSFSFYKAEYIAFMKENMRAGMETSLAQQGTPQSEDLERFGQSMQEEMPLLLTEFLIRNTLYLSLLLVIPAMLAYRLFFGPERQLAEIAVLLIYVQSMITLISIVSLPVAFSLGQTAIQIWGWLSIALSLGLAMWGVARFYGRSWTNLLLGALGYGFAYLCMMLMGAGVGIVWAISKMAQIKGITVLEALQRLVS